MNNSYETDTSSDSIIIFFTLQEVVMEIQELPSITRFIPKILLAITVTVCDEVYKKIAYWLNDMGKNHFVK